MSDWGRCSPQSGPLVLASSAQSSLLPDAAGLFSAAPASFLCHDSDHSSAETTILLLPPPGSGSSGGGAGPPGGISGTAGRAGSGEFGPIAGARRASPDLALPSLRPPALKAPPPGPGLASARAQQSPGPRAAPRKGQGYRKLWAMVSRVQRGERLSDAGAGREDVTVEDLIKTVQQLPASASAVDAIAAGLAYLDSRAMAALLKGLTKAGMGQRAVEIFDFLRALPPDHELSSLADIFTYTTAIAACTSHHQLRRALELVAEMRGRAVPLNVHTYSALLNVCLKANELDLGLDVYEQMLAEGCTPNLVTYNTLLDIYNKTGRWTDALGVMDLLQHQSIKPEARTYNAIMATCNAAGRHAEAVHVHKAMCAAGVEPNGATFNAALAAYARSGQVDAALGLFNLMASRGFERGANTYAALLAGCELPGRWELALELLQQMQMDSVRPSSACLTSAISACMHGGQPARAEQLFERMYAVCKPDACTFNCLVCVYARLGKHREAVNMLEVMLRGGQHVELTTFDAAIDACWASGVVGLQAYALQLHERARAQGLYQLLVAERACGGGGGGGAPVLDVQLPAGPPHVVLLSLLHMLRELRERLAGRALAPAGGRLLVRLAVQGQDAKALGHALATKLQSLGSPLLPIPQLPLSAYSAASVPGSAPVEELHFAADAAAAAEWLCGPAVAVALGLLAGGLGGGAALGFAAGRSVDGMMVAQDDAQRERKCLQALLSVQAFEGGFQVNLEDIPQTLLVQRGEVVQLLLHGAACLGLPADTGHDAAQLLDRVLSSAPPPNVPGRLLAAACLLLAMQQDAGAAAQMVAALFQVAPQQLLLAAQQARAALGGGCCVAISGMRVLRLLLERLGADGDGEAAQRWVCGQALTAMARAAASPAFVGCPPSVVAIAVLYTARIAAGLLPAWPAALTTLTGYSEHDELLQPSFKAAVQLMLEL